jgi:hypothetical protein
MKIILRDSLAGLYYGANHNWCDEVSEAMAFDSIQMAALVALDQDMDNVNVVLRYEEPICELVLPIERCIYKRPGVGRKDLAPRYLN